jgi:two-component system, LytTR family, response regulator
MAKLLPLSALIVDDENHARENLKMLLEDYCPEVKVVGTAGTVNEARQKILDLKPRVVFLDIRMPSGAEGFELLQSLDNKDFQVVFVTAFKDYAIQALNANAIHYILKPIDIEDLEFAVNKLVEYAESFSGDERQFAQYQDSVEHLAETIATDSSPKRLTLYHNKGFKIVETKNIVRLEADGNCTAFLFDDGSKYLDTKTLKIYDEILQEPQFLRIHKSHLINLACLKEYLNQEGHMAIMVNNDRVPIARNRLSHFLSSVRKFST